MQGVIYWNLRSELAENIILGSHDFRRFHEHA
jgi:hypothetical protein